jgi:Uma2 family endonuclease
MADTVKLTDRKAPPSGKITFEEFLEWADEDTHAEWENGEVVMVSPASRLHQDLVVWLTTILRLYVGRYGLGWISNAPFLMRLRTV